MLMELSTYSDFRRLLKDYYDQHKADNKRFSFRIFSRLCGFSSPGFLKMVINGERNLSVQAIGKIASVMKLNQKEASYFEALVHFNQAKTEQEREVYLPRLHAFKPHEGTVGLEKDQLEYYTQKHFVIIREMVSLPDFVEDPAWIGKNLSPRLKATEVEHAIEVLLRLKLLKRDSKGKLVPIGSSLATVPEVESLEVYKFHRSMLHEAAESLLKIPPELRDVTCLTIPIPRKTLEEVKGRIQQFRKDISKLINSGKDDYHEVYQMNIQLFPVTYTKLKKVKYVQKD